MSTTTTTTTAIRPTVSAENVIRLFPEVTPTNNTVAATASPSAEQHSTNGVKANAGADADADPDLAGHDAEQIRLMEEVCIVLDVDDNPIGSASKKTCHLMSNIEAGLLHRAFSCFLFDPRSKRLLLQQRASEKITFPDAWTNTCCSHPLAVAGETGADLTTSVAGAKRAAQRKLDQELGIKKEQVPLSGFDFLTRIHYKAPSDGKWGEHEIDYILFTEAEVDLAVNPNEVRDVRWVSADELRAMFKDSKLKFTPWFKLICETMLFKWWERVEQKPGLGDYLNETQIRRM